jgi:hypothetical protein
MGLRLPKTPGLAANRVRSDSVPGLRIGGVHGEAVYGGLRPAAFDVSNHRFHGGVVSQIAAAAMVEERYFVMFWNHNRSFTIARDSTSVYSTLVLCWRW